MHTAQLHGALYRFEWAELSRQFMLLLRQLGNPEAEKKKRS